MIVQEDDITGIQGPVLLLDTSLEETSDSQLMIYGIYNNKAIVFFTLFSKGGFYDNKNGL